METVRFRVYYDFASTLCYVAHRIMTGIETEVTALDVELLWQPIDLTTIVPWNRGDSFADEVRTAVRNTGLAVGLDIEMPDPWLDSRPTAEIALSISSASDESRWRRAVFETIFEHHSPEPTPELVTLATDLVGPDPAPWVAQSFPKVERSTREAEALGVTGVPTLLLHEWLVGGVYEGEAMLSLLEQLAEKYREVGSSSVN